MLLDSWATVKKGSFDSAEAFARPPFRSRQFLAATGLVTLLAVLDILMIVRLYGRLSSVSFAYIFLVRLIVLENWTRALVVHKRLHDLYSATKAGDALLRSPMDFTLGAASTLSYWGVTGTAMAGGAGRLALLQLIRHMR